MFQINVEKLVKDKLGKKLPKFLVKALKKIIHQDELNQFLATDGKEKVGLEFVEASLKFLDVWVKVIGAENLKIDDGAKYCFVSNHPLGGIDGLILIDVIGNNCNGNVKVFLNSILELLPGLKPFAIPINIVGNISKDTIKSVHSAFESDSQILMFPAQMCSRKQHGEIKDVTWQKRFVEESILHNRTIVPINFQGFNSKAFYNFAKFAKFLSKLFRNPNLEKLPMVFLPHEMMKNRGKEFTIIVGPPLFTPAELKLDKETMSYSEMARTIQLWAAALRE